MVKVSVILPTHNRCGYLGSSIKSLQDQTMPSDDYEIIVVDNASTDETSTIVEAINQNSSKKVVYIKEPMIGLHNARHAGARAARGEILAFVDDDAIYDKEWLVNLVSHYRDPMVGCVGGKIIPSIEGDVPDWIERFPKGFIGWLDLGDDVKELNTPSIYGANISIRRDLLFKLKGFNPDSFGAIWLGDGETGLLRKVLKTENIIIYEPKSVCWHLVPHEHLTISYIKKRAKNEGACASYAAYKGKEFDNITLMLRATGLLLYALSHKILSLIRRHINNKWVYNEWRASYGFSRSGYEFRLIFDREMRDLVLRDNWL